MQEVREAGEAVRKTLGLRFLQHHRCVHRQVIFINIILFINSIAIVYLVFLMDNQVSSMH